MDMPKSAHLVEIDHPSITESIDELFNNITPLMTDYALMYGGAVNSILASLPVKGDLDIAVSSAEFIYMAKNLANSSMWLQVDGQHIAEDDGSGRLRWSPTPEQGRDRYDETNVPMSQVAAFETVNGRKVHIIEAKIETGDLLEDALHIVRSVDLRCCGVALDRFGRLLEAIKGGYDDCMNRMLMLNMTDRLLDANRTKGRMHKYVKRGWQLGITIEQAVANINKAREQAARKAAAKVDKYKGKHKDGIGWRIYPHKTYGHEIRIHKRFIDAAKGDITRIRRAIQKVADYEYGMHIVQDDSSLMSRNYLRFFPDGKVASKECLVDIMKRAVSQLEKKFGKVFKASLLKSRFLSSKKKAHKRL